MTEQIGLSTPHVSHSSPRSVWTMQSPQNALCAEAALLSDNAEKAEDANGTEETEDAEERGLDEELSLVEADELRALSSDTSEELSRTERALELAEEQSSCGKVGLQTPLSSRMQPKIANGPSRMQQRWQELRLPPLLELLLLRLLDRTLLRRLLPELCTLELSSRELSELLELDDPPQRRGSGLQIPKSPSMIGRKRHRPRRWHSCALQMLKIPWPHCAQSSHVPPPPALLPLLLDDACDEDVPEEREEEELRCDDLLEEGEREDLELEREELRVLLCALPLEREELRVLLCALPLERDEGQLQTEELLAGQEPVELELGRMQFPNVAEDWAPQETRMFRATQLK